MYRLLELLGGGLESGGGIKHTEILHAPDPPMSISIWLVPVGMAIAAVLAAVVAMFITVPDAISNRF